MLRAQTLGLLSRPLATPHNSEGTHLHAPSTPRTHCTCQLRPVSYIPYSHTLHPSHAHSRPPSSPLLASPHTLGRAESRLQCKEYVKENGNELVDVDYSSNEELGNITVPSQLFANPRLDLSVRAIRSQWSGGVYLPSLQTLALSAEELGAVTWPQVRYDGFAWLNTANHLEVPAQRYILTTPSIQQEYYTVATNINMPLALFTSFLDDETGEYFPHEFVDYYVSRAKVLRVVSTT